MELQDALGHFQVQLAADGRSLHTRAQYERHVAGLIAWLQGAGLSTDVDEVTPALVADFFASDAARLSVRGGAKRATSVNAQHTSLRCLFRWLHESGQTSANAVHLLRRAKCTPPPARALHDDDQRRLLDVLDGSPGPDAARDRMLVELLLGTGIRIGSALGLEVGDLDFDHGEITLRRAKNDRPAVAVPRAIAAELRRFVGERASGPVFVAKDRQISARHAQRRLGCRLAKAGITGRSAHSLRHSFAAGLLARTGHLRLVQAALNHASIVSTTIYTAIGRARLREAIGA